MQDSGNQSMMGRFGACRRPEDTCPPHRRVVGQPNQSLKGQTFPQGVGSTVPHRGRLSKGAQGA